jgi:histidine triad (HIT) family protein
MADPCLFCRIVRREIPAKVVHETDDTLAFADIDPKAPVHVLVIPKQHIATLNDATDPAIIGRLALVAAELARAGGYDVSGYRTVINTNADGGQTVFHIHLHLLAGRRLGWPPG